MKNRILIAATFLAAAHLFAQGPVTPIGEATPGATPPGPSAVSPLDATEQLMRERAAKDGARGLNPNLPRSYNFYDEGLVRVLRLLAAEAQMNFVAPALKADERVSTALLNVTPREAFEEICRARGFKVQQRGAVVTITRPDLGVPQASEARSWRLRHASVDVVFQALCNLLGLTMPAVADSNPAFPKPASTVGGAVNTVDAQARPRFTPGLQFDEGVAKAPGRETSAFMTRRHNTITVRGTPEELAQVDAFMATNDIEVPELRITAYLVEVAESNDSKIGLDFSSSLGPATGLQLGLSRTGTAGGLAAPLLNAGAAVLIQGAILNAADLTASLHALRTNSRTKFLATPTLFAPPGVPVPLVDIQKETIALTQPSTVGNTTTVNTSLQTFVTGVTVQVTPRLLGNGRIALNIDPKISSRIGETTSTVGRIPTISERGIVSEVTLNDGEAVVLGGILSSRSAVDANGIPGLSKIPILGYLFKSNGQTYTRSNLLIIVHAETVRRSNRAYPYRVGVEERDTVVRGTIGLPGEPPPIRQAVRVVPTTTVVPAGDGKTTLRRKKQP